MSPKPPAPVAGRPRSEEARAAILSAAFELMGEVGFDRLSIEAVAARAGTGKATIYRWWPNKGVLAVEAFLELTRTSIAFPQSGSARADMIEQLQRLARVYRGSTGRFVREMIGASQGNEEMRDAFRAGFLAPRREAARETYARGVATGEFRAGVDPDVAIDAFYGALYYRLLTSGDSISTSAIDALAGVVLEGLAAPVKDGAGGQPARGQSR
jgi:AcrR family transcriptional regulator